MTYQVKTDKEDIYVRNNATASGTAKSSTVDAALREFAEYGYEQASTNRIAKEAGLSKPLMFHYVGNKQQLFLFVYEYFFDLLNKEYYRQLDCTEPDVIKRLHGAYRLQLRLLYAYPWVFDFLKCMRAWISGI